MKIIAHIKTDFPEKFGVPRQSGLVNSLIGKIIFEPEYRNPDALKGIEGFNYLWILWEFEGTNRDTWSATVKPPRLGGNTHVGVFATRSPFRPNPIGLSSVKIDHVDFDCIDGPVIYVCGPDMRDNTPIYDLKPYLPYVDSHPDATDGFAKEVKDHCLQVIFPEDYLKMFENDKRKQIIDTLKQDPRPAYHNDPDRLYGLSFAGYDVHFKVNGNILTVYDVEKL